MMLITDYHQLGSLYDYLRRGEPLDMKEALELALSTVSGLEHLHNAVHGTGSRRKPEVAHRDIKSKNVIVKRPGVCCIADFGLAVRLENGVVIPEKVNIQVGTKRYMSPEVLAKRLNVQNFGEFKMSDMYSYSLVLWEIVRRIQDTSNSQPNRRHQRMISYSSSSGIASGSGSGGSGVKKPTVHIHAPNLGRIHQQQAFGNFDKSDDTSIEARPHILPYQSITESDPSFEQMRGIVCDKKIRPTMEDEWLNGTNTTMKQLCELMEEGWSENATSRHTALKVKKELGHLLAAEVRKTSVEEPA
jgi:bone morphogenetic protein receptor type-1B